MRNYLALILLFVVASVSYSQENKPYFQQQVNYNIHVALDDEKHELVATETIEYTNNSPDKIEFIYFHLWPNGYKNYNTALGNQKLEEGDTKMYYAAEEDLGFIEGLNFTTNNIPLQWELDSIHEDICKVYLKQPLLPGESVEISTPFKVKLPKGIFSRLGHMGQSYQITQWYPKPAVYDRDGWHPMPYLNQGEFYSEYGTFDVYITLPKNYRVGATGDLIDGEQELEWLNRIAKKTLQIEMFNRGDMSFPLSDDSTKILHYYQKNVHDFAWFADKRYHVLKGEVELPHSKRKVTTWTMFTNNEAGLWSKSIEYMNDAVYYYSLWNGDYPYNQVTAVDGALSAGGGMEYPNVTVIGASESAFRLETVIMHEVGHNWFYGILGSNERDHPWMDEGLNTMNENRYIETKYPDRKLLGAQEDVQNNKIAKWFDLEHYKHKAEYELSYLLSARLNQDQPIEEKAANYIPMNYGGIVYAKTAFVFDYLMAYLGEEAYDKAMQRYFNEWKFKHPQPNDLRKIFEEESGKDLSWFFDDLIKTTKKIDYKITGAKKDKDDLSNILLKVKNKGRVNGPFSISGIKNGKIVSTQWYEPIGDKKTVSFKKTEVDNYRIDAQLDIPEIQRKNNTLKAKGLLKKTEPLRIQFLGSLENPNKTQLFFAPIVGWNYHDKAMVGMAFYNSLIPAKKFEYVLAPMYSFKSKNINGYANAYYHIAPSNIFQDISIGVKSSSFSNFTNTMVNSAGERVLEYYKLAPEVVFQFKKRKPRSYISSSLSYRFVTIFEEQADFFRDTVEGIPITDYTISVADYYVNDLTYVFKRDHPINSFKVTVNAQQSVRFVKLNATTNYHHSYRNKKTGFDARLFVGTFLYEDNASSRYNYNLSGNSDYLYDQLFLARNTTNGILNQQFAVNDGGFKNLTLTRSTNQWIGAINLTTTLPIKWLGLYADFGAVGLENTNAKGKDLETAYNIGATIIIVPTFFEVYFPIFMSSDLNQLDYQDKIRFTLNLNMAKPLQMLRDSAGK